MTVVGALKWSDTSIVSRRSIFSHASTTTFSRITIGPRRRGEEDSRRQKRKTSLSLYISFLETSTKRRSTVTGRALSGEFRWKTPGQAIVGGGRKRRGGDWIVKWLVVTLICAMRNVETNRTSSSLRRSLSRGSVLMIRKRVVVSKRFYRRSRSFRDEQEVIAGEQVIEGRSTPSNVRVCPLIDVQCTLATIDGCDRLFADGIFADVGWSLFACTVMDQESLLIEMESDRWYLKQGSVSRQMRWRGDVSFLRRFFWDRKMNSRRCFRIHEYILMNIVHEWSVNTTISCTQIYL